MDFLGNGVYEGICAFPFGEEVADIGGISVLSLAVDSSVSILFP